jgi:hypothetical protein
MLPPKLLNHRGYWGLTLPQALAQYAYSLSTPKSIYTDPIIELPAQRAIDAPPFYCDPPVGRGAAFQPLDLKCQSEGPLKTATNPESGEHGQGLSDFTPIGEASDQGDLDEPILPVRLAYGKTKLLGLPQSDHESAPQPIAAYATGRQNRLRVPRAHKFRPKNDGRTPIRKALHPKPVS